MYVPCSSTVAVGIVNCDDNTEHEVDVRLLHYDDTFKVLPDSTIITDGEVVAGNSTVDESMMTG